MLFHGCSFSEGLETFNAEGPHPRQLAAVDDHRDDARIEGLRSEVAGVGPMRQSLHCAGSSGLGEVWNDESFENIEFAQLCPLHLP